MSLDSFLKSLGENIAAFRKSRFLTQKDVAEQAGISYRYFQSIESGSANITLSTLYRLASFFGVHASDFFPRKAD